MTSTLVRLVVKSPFKRGVFQSALEIVTECAGGAVPIAPRCDVLKRATNSKSSNGVEDRMIWLRIVLMMLALTACGTSTSTETSFVDLCQSQCDVMNTFSEGLSCSEVRCEGCVRDAHSARNAGCEAEMRQFLECYIENRSFCATEFDWANRRCGAAWEAVSVCATSACGDSWRSSCASDAGM